jgi:hypothetical protein
MKNKTATTIKIPSDTYDEFKIAGIRNKISLQELVEKCINLYISDSDFKNKINSYIVPDEIIITTESVKINSPTQPPIE